MPHFRLTIFGYSLVDMDLASGCNCAGTEDEEPDVPRFGFGTPNATLLDRAEAFDGRGHWHDDDE